MYKKQRCCLFSITILLLASASINAQAVNFDIGAPNWYITLPGSATYDTTNSGVQVTGIADRIVNVSSEPTAVYSGNDDPAVNRNYSYIFPPGSTVSIDFFQLTMNSMNQAEAVGNFSSIPSQSNLGNGHNIIGLDFRLEGSAAANIDTVSTLTWTDISSLSFDVASNGNVAFVGHRNMVVSGGRPLTVPTVSNWAIFGLILIILLFVIKKSQPHARSNHV